LCRFLPGFGSLSRKLSSAFTANNAEASFLFSISIMSGLKRQVFPLPPLPVTSKCPRFRSRVMASRMARSVALQSDASRGWLGQASPVVRLTKVTMA
jgi:hypothetical protein